MLTNSYYIKTSLLFYFRFIKSMGYVATECTCHGYNVADVLAYDGEGKLVEVEVKVSKADLKNDKLHKATKHKFAEGDQRVTMGGQVLPSLATESGRPTHFYFCVPEELAEEAIKEAEIINPKYGVLTCHDNTDNCKTGKYGSGILGYNIKVVKKAQQLHKLPITKSALYKIAARCSSELLNMRKDMHNAQNT